MFEKWTDTPNPIPDFLHNNLTNTLSPPDAVLCSDTEVVFGGDFKAIQKVNLRVLRGERLALVGRSGCGKTTLLRVIAGLQRVSGGVCEVRDADAISFVFQQPALLPWRTVRQNVSLPIQLGQGHQVSGADVDRAIEEVELGHVLDHFPHQLSGGMKMRVSIARAIVTQPKLLLLDEPFAALDDPLRAQLGDLVTDLWRRHDLTMVLVTHNISEAIALCDRIAVMQLGRLTDVLENPVASMEERDLRRTPEFAAFHGRVGDALRAPVGNPETGAPA